MPGFRENSGGRREAVYANGWPSCINDLQAKQLRLYVNAQVGANDAFLKGLGKSTDAVILMNYDQHESESEPGPVAAQDWFETNLSRTLKLISQREDYLWHW